jgi:soluble lytic murein transglycosylase-like protein
VTRLGTLIFCGLILLGAAAEAATRPEVKRIVVEESLRAGFPPSLAMAVAKAESDFDDAARSSAGARGVMQIMPKTARDLYGVAPDELWDARLNVQLGIDYLESLIRRYKGRWNIALSHYNGGSAVGDPSDPRVIPATSAYVNKVLRLQRQYRAEARSWAAELKNETGELAMIRAPYARSEDNAARPGPSRRHSGYVDNQGSGSRDVDFGKTIEARRRIARRHLDDFAPMMIGSDG